MSSKLYSQADRDKVELLRIGFITKKLELNTTESEKFWPVYNEYQAAFEQLRDRVVRQITLFSEKYDTLTDDEAKSMLNEMMSVQQDEQDVRKEFLPNFEAVLPINPFVISNNKLCTASANVNNERWFRKVHTLSYSVIN